MSTLFNHYLKRSWLTTVFTKLSGILQSWMKSQWKDEGTNLLNDLFSSRKTIKEKPSLTANLDQKFKMENFDLIVWEYISKGN